MFKVGDRVIGTVRLPQQRAVGVCGTIREFDGKLCLVEFDEDVDGHAGGPVVDNKYKYGHCWWCNERDISPLNEPKFKKGDLVRIKSTEFRSSYNTVLEKVGTIVDVKYEQYIDDENTTYKVKVDSFFNEYQLDGLWVFHDEDSLEPYVDDQADSIAYAMDGIKANWIILDDIIKGDNNMDNIMKIYEDRKVEKINKKYDQLKNLLRMGDPRYKVWRECVDTLNKMYKEDEVLDFLLPTIRLSEETIKRISVLDTNRCDEVTRLHNKINEVNAQLQMCETYEQKQEILKRYNIVNKNGKINA